MSKFLTFFIILWGYVASADTNIVDPVLKIPKWTESTKPTCTTPFGCIGLNTELNEFMGYDGTNWKYLSGEIKTWVSGKKFYAGDLAINQNEFFKCINTHTAGTYWRDNQADWEPVSLQDIGTGITSWTSPQMGAGTLPNTFKIYAGTGLIVKSSVNTKQQFKYITWPDIDNLSPVGLGNDFETFVFIDETGTIVQRTSFSPIDLQSMIRLGIVFHNTGTAIDSIRAANSTAINTNLQLTSLIYSLGYFKTNVENNAVFSGNANLTMTRTSGEVHSLGANDTSIMMPNLREVNAQSPAVFDIYKNNGIYLSNQTNVPKVWDDNGTIKAIPPQNYGAHAVYYLPNGNAAILLSQKEYATLKDAEVGYTEGKTIPAALASGVFYTANIGIRGGTTALNNTTDVDIQNCGKFGCGQGGGGGGAGGLGGDMFGPANSVQNNFMSFADGTGKIAKDSGVLSTNVVTKTSNFSAADRVVLANGIDKILSETGYTIPKTVGTNGQILKSNGTNLTFQADNAGTGDVVGPSSTFKGAIAIYDDTTGKVLNKNNSAWIDDSDGVNVNLSLGGTNTARRGTISLMENDNSGVILYPGFNGTAKYTLMFPVDAPSNQVMKFSPDGTGTWTTPGDVISAMNAGGSTPGNIPKWESDGKTLSGSNAYWESTNTLHNYGPVKVGGQLTVNNEGNSYALPTTRGNSGEVLTSNGGTAPTWATKNTPGEIFMFGGANCPSGSLVADGSVINRTTYSALFTAISTVWGAGDGSTTFSLPDLRDKFIRGVSATRAIAGSEASQTKLPTNPFTTDSQGNHTHLSNKAQGDQNYNGGSGNVWWGSVVQNQTTSAAGAHTHTITGGGDAETRPASVFVKYCIYY
jgi:microcystin-dependent protein